MSAGFALGVHPDRAGPGSASVALTPGVASQLDLVPAHSDRDPVPPRVAGVDNPEMTAFFPLLLAGDENDNVLTAHNRPDPQTIESRGGDEGGDVLIGNTAADTILGDGGYDTADGYGGDDTCSAEVVTRCEPMP